MGAGDCSAAEQKPVCAFKAVEGKPLSSYNLLALL
jgi:hypothetical protein